MYAASARTVLIVAIVAASWASSHGQGPPAVSAFSYGGSLTEIVKAVAVDSQYNIYVVGRSDSRDLPGVEHGYQKIPRGTDAFVAKLTWDGRPQWATFLGGGDAGSNRFGVTPDEARAIAVDAQGNVYVGGSTASVDFPTVNAYQPAKRGTGVETDGFLAKLDPTGRLLFSTYLGGAGGSSSVEHIAIGSTGEVVVGINTSSRQFEVTRDLTTTATGLTGNDGLVIGRFHSNGMPSWLVRTGLGNDHLRGITVDGQLSVTVTASSPGVPCGSGVCSGSYLQRINASGASADLRVSVPGGTSAGVAAFADGAVVVAGGHSGAGLTAVNPWQANADIADNGFAAVVGGSAVDVMTFVPGVADHLRLATNPTGRMHLVFDSRGSSIGLLGTPPIEHPHGPVFTSGDRGDSWSWASPGLIGGAIVAVDHARKYLYAIIDSKVFRSSDEGRSWSHWFASPAVLSRLATVAVDPLDPTIMYLSDSGLWRLEQDGRRVVTVRDALPGAGGGFRMLGVDPVDGTLWGYSGLGTIEISRDRGTTWSVRRDFRDPIKAIAFNSHRAGDVLISAGSAAFRSTDYGVTWVHATANTGSIEPESVAIDPADPRRLYAEDRSFRRRLLLSPDNGATWYETLHGFDIHSIAVSNVPPFQVTLSVTDQRTNDSYALVTGDGGTTWSRRGALPPSVVTHVRGDAYRLVAASGATARPFLTRIDRGSGGNFVRTAGMFLEQGEIGGIAAARDGESVVVLTQRFDVRVLKINR